MVKINGDYKQAKSLIRQEKIADGLEVLKKLAPSGHSAEVFNDAGVCYHLLGDSERGLDMFRLALEKAPAFALARINLFYLEKARELKRGNDLTFRSINHDGLSPNTPRPRISVIVRTYNRPDLLKEALASLKNQIFKDFETIVINDGCTEEAAVVCKEADLPGLRYFNAPHKGPAAALNRGLEMARGDYITFLDDDDIIYPNHLSGLLDRLEKAGRPGVAYSDTSIASFDKNGKLAQSRIRSEPSVDLEKIFHYCPIPIQSMVSRECFERVGQFLEPLVYDAHDWEMWMRIAKRYNFYHLAEVTSEIRNHHQLARSSRRSPFGKYYYGNLAHYFHQGIALFSFPKFERNERAYQIAVGELGLLLQKYPDLEKKIRLYRFYHSRTVHGYFYARYNSLKMFREFKAANDFLKVALKLKPLEPKFWASWLSSLFSKTDGADNALV